MRTWGAIAANDHAKAVEHLLAMRASGAGWWSIGVKPTMVLTRELFYSGMPEMLPSVARSTGGTPLLEGAQNPVTAYLKAFQAWAENQPKEAMAAFCQLAQYMDSLPPLRPTQPDGDGGAKSLEAQARDLMKQARPESFGQAQTRHPAPSSAAPKLSATKSRPSAQPPALALLSLREQQVTERVARGMSNKEIANVRRRPS
ncbi:response regulator transcription factor [Nesterenkonia sp. MY13]|uniref:Response regulator transcription factor n=1 Tax=Nesterenkonia sedimenti TaxID=1463632 RepID=A0A7X8TM41_9MICC|nr:response regulator transcription factor [Nesterenkonia sedimenti]NLS11084.1 response regulator transcription factor [Nesterenkonia sedimenti]